MLKLLHANFYRLRKNKVFIGIIIITIIASFVILFNTYQGNITNEKYNMQKMQIDRTYTIYINVISFLIAVFVSIFVGSDYDNGTIRNKIIVGHSRKNIYLSNLIVSIIVGLVLEIIYLIIISIVGIPLIGKIQMNIFDFLYIILDMILLIMVFSSIFNFISMICSNVTLSTVGSLLLILIMYVFCMSISGIAYSTKELKIQDFDENGNLVTKYLEDENYPGDFKKNLCKTIINILPTGQAMELSEVNIDINEIKIYPLYSLGVILIINILGIYMFNKKELK